jgi:murein L,D-transpeptidase YcbB/YkuD
VLGGQLHIDSRELRGSLGDLISYVEDSNNACEAKLNRVLGSRTLQVLFAFRDAMSAIAAPKSTNPSIETSTKDTFVSRMSAEALRLDVPSKLFAVAHKVINRPRSDYILAGAALALILAVMFKIFAHGNTFLALRAEQASTGSSLTAAPVSESPATALATANPESAPGEKVPDPLALLDPADRVIAEKIRDLLAARSDKIFASKKEREAVEAFYQKRSLAPLWLDKGIENARAKSVIARIKNADADGLDLSDYNLPNFSGLGPGALAEADLRFTQTVITYARHVQAGRFPYHSVSRNIQLPQAPPEPPEVLRSISAASDAGKALDKFSPQQEPYQKLKVALAQLRNKTGGARSEIADGPVLTYSREHQMEDPRVPLVRERLKLAGDPSDLRYDATVADAVKNYQRANQLPATGSLDARTVRELSGPTHDKQIEIIIANMERWRWYPHDLGSAYVLVNQPDFTLKVMHDGHQVWATQIVIGKPSMPTPLLSETMKYITINPTWHVPPSIVQNEYLPALAQDPSVLARMGLRVHYGRDGVEITQPPGDKNALGRIRFNFPNRFLVYQHDTPDKYMFGHDVRAESHGCMRVQDPAKYAEVLLNIVRPDEHWTVEKIESMFGSAEQNIQLQAMPIWVHLTYQTAFVDDDGKLQMRRDVYNLDSRTVAAIRSERANIDSVPEGKSEQVIASGGTRRTGRPLPDSFFPSFFFAGRPLRPPRCIY